MKGNALGAVLPLLLMMGSVAANAQEPEPPDGIVFRDPFIGRDGTVLMTSVAPPDSIVFRSPFIGRDSEVTDTEVVAPHGIVFRNVFIGRDGLIIDPTVAAPTGIVFREPFIGRSGVVLQEDVPPPSGIVFRGLFIGRNGQPTAVEPVLPQRTIVLGSVSPNPFNPGTQVTFRLTAASEVTVSVLDVRGRVVRRLHQGELPADLHVLRWDGKDDSGQAVASGVYLFRIDAGSESVTARGVLLK